MKPRSAKAKGRTLQNWVGKKVAEVTGRPFGKDQEIEGREMGQAGNDLKLYGKALELFPFSVECQNAETWNVNAKIKQVKSNLKEGTDWLCFFKRNKEKPIVILSAESFFSLYNRILNNDKI